MAPLSVMNNLPDMIPRVTFEKVQQELYRERDQVRRELEEYRRQNVTIMETEVTLKFQLDIKTKGLHHLNSLLSIRERFLEAEKEQWILTGYPPKFREELVVRRQRWEVIAESFLSNSNNQTSFSRPFFPNQLPLQRMLYIFVTTAMNIWKKVHDRLFNYDEVLHTKGISYIFASEHEKFFAQNVLGLSV